MTLHAAKDIGTKDCLTIMYFSATNKQILFFYRKQYMAELLILLSVK